MTIGFFGGSFDPPHRGHIALARLAAERLGLARILFAPVGMQPLKRDRPQASFEDRVAMLQLAIAGEPHTEVSLIDAPRADGRPNYTIDAIRALRATLQPSTRISCLMGADSFLSIGHWYRSDDLLMACDFVVGARPGFDLGRLAAALPATISVGACDPPHPETLALCLRHGSKRATHLYLLPDLAVDVSASAVRSALHRGLGWSSVLDPRVAAFIEEHGLYREDAAAPR